MDDLREEFINQIETIENECKQKIKKEEFKQELINFEKSIKSFGEQCSKWSRELNEMKKEFDKDYWCAAIKKCDVLKKDLNDEQSKLVKCLCGRIMEFFPNECVPCFGILKETIYYENIHIKNKLNGHSDDIQSLVLLPSGDLASGSRDNRIKIWNRNDWSLKHTLEGHADNVYSLVVLSNGVDLASVSSDGSIKIWNTQDWIVKRELAVLEGSVSLLVLRNGDLVCGSKKVIYIWDTDNWFIKKILEGHESWVWSLVQLANDNFLASGSSDDSIKIWDINDGVFITTLTEHFDTINSLLILPTTGYLVSGSSDKTIKIWNTDGWSVLCTLHGHKRGVYSLAILRNGDLLSGSEDRTIIIWNTTDWSLIKTFDGHTSCVRSLLVFPNGDFASSDKLIRVWSQN